MGYKPMHLLWDDVQRACCYGKGKVPRPSLKKSFIHLFLIIFSIAKTVSS